MKRIIVLSCIVLAAAFSAPAQRNFAYTVYSHEMNFMAVFPEAPEESEGRIEAAFGNIPAKVWVLERPGVVYQISVGDASGLGVKMDTGSLRTFYETGCTDLISKGYTNYNMFGEHGTSGGWVTKKQSRQVSLFLGPKRLYVISAVMDREQEQVVTTVQQVKDFMDGFVFVHVKEGKLTYGLPQSVSQNLENK